MDCFLLLCKFVFLCKYKCCVHITCVHCMPITFLFLAFTVLYFGGALGNKVSGIKIKNINEKYPLVLFFNLVIYTIK